MFGRAAQGLSITFATPAAALGSACGAWQALTPTRDVLGKSREARGASGESVTTPLRLATPPAGSMLLRWNPPYGAASRAVQLDKVLVAS